MIFLYMTAVLVAGCSLCYYLGSQDRRPSKADKKALTQVGAQLAEILTLKRELKKQTALAETRGYIIEDMKKWRSKV